MTELKNYDDAVIRFRKGLTYNTLPLLSWDLYSEHNDTQNEGNKDIQDLLKIAATNSWNLNPKIIEDKLKLDKNVVVITDTKLNIVFATKNIWYMNQYTPQEVIGNKPKMFQGRDTSKTSLKLIREAINSKQAFETKIINYKKDGEPYVCWIKGQPIFDLKGALVNFIAFEKEVA